MLERIDAQDVMLSVEVDGEGPLVICAHGFPDCQRTFRLQRPALVAAGYRVALPTMRGYWPSGEARSRRYDVVALGADLLAIADALSPSAPVHLVGHDWGASAAHAASVAAPERVASVSMLALPHVGVALPRWIHPRQLRRSWYIGLFQLPGVAERRLRAADGALIERLWRAWSPGYRCPDDEMRRVKDAVLPRATAVLSYYRALFRDRRGGVLRSRVPVRSLQLHGADDGCIGVELTQGLERGYAAGFEQDVLQRAGHFLHLEQPDRVNRRLIEFLQRPT